MPSSPLSLDRPATLSDVASSELPVFSGGVIEDILLGTKPALAQIRERYGQFKDYLATVAEAADGAAVLAGSEAQFYYTCVRARNKLLVHCWKRVQRLPSSNPL